MRYNILVHRYAKALLESAVNNNVLDKVLDDLKLINDTIEQNKELRTLINRSFIAKTHKINILNSIFKDRIEKTTMDFIVLMLNKNREAYIEDIYEMYYDLYLVRKKIAVVTVTTAVELDEHTTERIVNILRHKIVEKETIEIKNVVDKNIIGGFIVKYGDYQYDASVIATLKRLHKVFDENLFVKAY